MSDSLYAESLTRDLETMLREAILGRPAIAKTAEGRITVEGVGEFWVTVRENDDNVLRAGPLATGASILTEEQLRHLAARGGAKAPETALATLWSGVEDLLGTNGIRHTRPEKWDLARARYLIEMADGM